MSGSCHEATIELLVKLQKRLHPKHCHRTEVGIGMGFGMRMAINMALGLISMSMGNLSLGSDSKEAVACLLIALYPTLPSSSTDNRHHLQALRHFYVLAARERRLSMMDVDSGSHIKGVKARVISKNDSSSSATKVEGGSKAEEELQLTTPCLIPLTQLKGSHRIEVEDEGYMGQGVSIGQREGSFVGSVQMMIKRKGELLN